jgi:hypothetical protein
MAGSRDKAASPAAIRLIHRMTTGSGQQERYRSSRTVPTKDVLAHFHQRLTDLGVRPTRDLLNLYELSAHHVVPLNQREPQSRLTEAQRAHESTPAQAEICPVADGRHLLQRSQGWNVGHAITLSNDGDACITWAALSPESVDISQVSISPQAGSNPNTHDAAPASF